MIRVRYSACRGDRVAPTVTDDLIATYAMAEKRAEQELADHLKVRVTRDLNMPLDSTIDIHQYRNFHFSRLGIHGLHRITSFSLDITPGQGSISLNVQAEEYKTLCMTPA
jgi:hypothetical protein